MNFLKSVFSDEQTPPDSPKSQDNQSDSSTWKFGTLLKTLASKSDSVIETYRRDLQELSSGIQKETAVIRDVASRSFESGASVAQHSLESVGQAIDDIGNIVLKSTAQIISHGNTDLDRRELNLDVKRYSRFENEVRVLQCDLNTYCNVGEDEVEFEKWRLEGFVLDEKREEIERIYRENGVVREIYMEVVPNRVDEEGFWSRYFYKVWKLKQVEEARERLLKRANSAEDLRWDFDEDEEEKGESSGIVETSTAAGVSSQSVAEEEDLGWDQIEDVGNDDGTKPQIGGGSASRVDIRKRLSSAEEEEDLSWDIEDEDDDSVKP